MSLVYITHLISNHRWRFHSVRAHTRTMAYAPLTVYFWSAYTFTFSLSLLKVNANVLEMRKCNDSREWMHGVGCVFHCLRARTLAVTFPSLYLIYTSRFNRCYAQNLLLKYISVSHWSLPNPIVACVLKLFFKFFSQQITHIQLLNLKKNTLGFFEADSIGWYIYYQSTPIRPKYYLKFHSELDISV